VVHVRAPPPTLINWLQAFNRHERLQALLVLLRIVSQKVASLALEIGFSDAKNHNCIAADAPVFPRAKSPP
jgi:hypothetical protein